MKYGVHEQDKQICREIQLVINFPTQVVPRIGLIFYSQASWSKRVELFRRDLKWRLDDTAARLHIVSFYIRVQTLHMITPIGKVASTCIDNEGRKVTYLHWLLASMRTSKEPTRGALSCRRTRRTTPATQP